MTASTSPGLFGKVRGHIRPAGAGFARARDIARLERLIEERIRAAVDEAISANNAPGSAQNEAIALIGQQAEALQQAALAEMGRRGEAGAEAALADVAQRVAASERTVLARTETRVRIGTWEAEAAAAALVQKESRAVLQRMEGRIRTASMEAKAFADEGLGSLSRSIAAAGRVVAMLVRRVDAGDAARAAMLDRVDRLDAALDAAAANDRVAREQAEAAAASHQALLGRVHALEGGFLTADTQTRERLDLLTADVLGAVEDYNEQLRHAEADIVALREDCNRRLASIEAAVSQGERTQSERFDRIEQDAAAAAARLNADAQAAAAIGHAIDTRPPYAGRDTDPARIRNKAKINALGADGLRLQIGGAGAGDENVVQVDERPVPWADIVAPIDALPLEDGSVREIAISHIVGSVSADRLESTVLPHWHRLLASGGRIDTVMFDGQAMLEHWRDGTISFESVQKAFVCGGGDRPPRRNLLTPQDYLQALTRAGFANADIRYAGQRNGDSFEFCVSATKP